MAALGLRGEPGCRRAGIGVGVGGGGEAVRRGFFGLNGESAS